MLAIATTLRFYQLGEEGVWVDEMGSMGDAARYWERPSAHRPLYYILLNVWMRFGQSDIWLRSLAVIFGIGSVWLVYRLGAQLLSRRVGLVAGLMMALSPLFINHSQEIRMYSLSSFLSLAGTLAMSYALERPARSPLALWAITRWLAVLTTPLNLVLLLPDGLLVAYRWLRRPRKFLRFLLGSLFVIAGSIPTLYAQIGGGGAVYFLENQVADYSKPGLLQVFGMVTQFAAYWPLRYLIESQAEVTLGRDELGDRSLLGHVLSNLDSPLSFYAGLTLLLLGLFFVTLMLMWRHRQSFALVALAAWALVPSAAILAVSYVSSSLWFPRYLIGFAPYYLLLLSAGFVWLCETHRLKMGKWPVGAYAIAALYGLGVFGGLKDYYGPHHYRNKWRQASELVEAVEQPGDVIVYYSMSRHYDYSFPRYYQGKSPIVFMDRPPTATTLDRDYIWRNLPADIPPQSRLWVVCWWYCDDPQGVENVATVLGGDGFALEQKTSFQSLGLYPIGISLFAPAGQLVNDPPITWPNDAPNNVPDNLPNDSFNDSFDGAIDDSFDGAISESISKKKQD